MASRLSTSPVQEPQLADALQVARIASSVVAPPSMQETTLALETPLQPQISASSESAATAALGFAEAPPPEAKAWPKISASRTCDTSSCLFSRSRSEEHTSELQSLMRISYAVFCLKK